jgi:hypothetical protein
MMMEPTCSRWFSLVRKLNRLALAFGLCLGAYSSPATPPGAVRCPDSDSELRFWLENMIVHHGYTTAEVTAATGLSADEVKTAALRFNLGNARPATRQHPVALRVLPYPGGRHPRMGFLDGAVNPQRDTKVSIFTPWSETGYVVVDVPEAVFCDQGLTYLAHTHVKTLWDLRGIPLPPLEWQRLPGGQLAMERTLPDGVAFGTRVTPRPDGIRFDLWLRNGTTNRLTDLRVQNCVMLKMAEGFNDQTNQHTVFAPPYAAIRSKTGNRWIITAFAPCFRPWANPPVPCLHSDPKFPDCAPGETTRIRGWLSFYEGDDVQREFKRLETLGWREVGSP